MLARQSFKRVCRPIWRASISSTGPQATSCAKCAVRLLHSSSGPSPNPGDEKLQSFHARKLHSSSPTRAPSVKRQSAASRQTPDSGTGTITVLGREYTRDDYTNIPSSILSRLSETPILLSTPGHPLNLLQRQVREHLANHTNIYPPPSPVVTSELNFGDLGFPPDHPGRSPTDTYYANRGTCLRTHTSAHEVETFAKGLDAWLLCADVYRRDEIDASHYPIFHQMEGARVFDPSKGDYDEGGLVQRECETMEAELRKAAIEVEDQVNVQEAGGYQDGMNVDHAEKAMRHLKATLNGLILSLFGRRHAVESAAALAHGPASADTTVEPLKVRWVSATFPFTSPSFEIEVWFRGEWLEILGCGVVKQRTLDKAGVSHKLGWAFGLGLERIAMVLYSIPDIRLFWSKDPRFLAQFATAQSGMLDDRAGQLSGQNPVSAAGGRSASRNTRSAELITFKPYSKHPPCYKDISFWLPSSSATTTRSFHENDVFEIVRDTVGDVAESVELIDEFAHPRTKRRSLCYRINYRSMDRNLENEEVNRFHTQVVQRLVDELGVQPR